MQRPDAGEVRDLMPARDAARDEDRAGHEARAPPATAAARRSPRHLEVLARVAERSGHAAAAGVEIDHGRAGIRPSSALAGARQRPSPSDDSGRAAGFATGPAPDRAARVPPGIPFSTNSSKSTARSATRRARRCALAAEQRRHVLANRREAAGLEEHDRLPALGQRIEPLRVRLRLAPRAPSSSPCEISGRPQQTLRRELGRRSPPLEHLHSGHADAGIVVVREGVVEERRRCRTPSRDASPLGAAPMSLKRSRTSSPSRPAAPAGDRGRAAARSASAPARSARSRSTAARTGCPSATRVDVAEHARAQRRAVPAPVVGEELALEPRDVDADGALGLARPALEAQVEHLAARRRRRGPPRPAGPPSPAAARWRGRASSAPPRASPCTTGTSSRPASCGRRRGRCTSRPRRPCRRTRE